MILGVHAVTGRSHLWVYATSDIAIVLGSEWCAEFHKVVYSV